jgi:hypothetical protein
LLPPLPPSSCIQFSAPPGFLSEPKKDWFSSTRVKQERVQLGCGAAASAPVAPRLGGHVPMDSLVHAILLVTGVCLRGLCPQLSLSLDLGLLFWPLTPLSAKTSSVIWLFCPSHHSVPTVSNGHQHHPNTKCEEGGRISLGLLSS